MGDNLAKQLVSLAEEGEQLIREGHPDGNINTWDEITKEWVKKCSSILQAAYGGRSSEQAKSFRNGSGSIAIKISILKALAAQAQDSITKKEPFVKVNQISNQNVNQISNVFVEISNQISLFIEYSVPIEQKEEVYQIFNEVKDECEKAQTNWDRVVDLLKKSFDYGLKIAPELVKLASAYYSAKGGT